MKKTLLIATLAASLSGLSAFAQGSFVFSSSAGWVWNNFSVVAPTRDANEKVGFLINLTGAGGSGLLGAVKSNVETNALSLYNANAANEAWTPAQAWTAILNDPNWAPAINNGTSGAAGTVIGTTTATGGITYNGGSSFFINGTANTGGSILVRIFAWDAQYADPAAAAAAGSAVGWGNTFSYAYGATSGTPANFSSQAGSANGGARVGVFAPVPEPTTFALAGLGMAAMLVSRRRK